MPARKMKETQTKIISAIINEAILLVSLLITAFVDVGEYRTPHSDEASTSTLRNLMI